MKTLRILLAVFMVMLVTGISYAAVTGNINFLGTATFEDQLDITLINTNITDNRGGTKSGGDCIGTVSFTNSNATGVWTANMTIYFIEPGDVVTYTFRIDNNSTTVAAVLGPWANGGTAQLVTTGATGWVSGAVKVTGTYASVITNPTNLDVAAAPGTPTSTSTFTVIVTWDNTVAGADLLTGTVTFSLSLAVSAA